MAGVGDGRCRSIFLCCGFACLPRRRGVSPPLFFQTWGTPVFFGVGQGELCELGVCFPFCDLRFEDFAPYQNFQNPKIASGSGLSPFNLLFCRTPSISTPNTPHEMGCLFVEGIRFVIFGGFPGNQQEATVFKGSPTKDTKVPDSRAPFWVPIFDPPNTTVLLKPPIVHLCLGGPIPGACPHFFGEFMTPSNMSTRTRGSSPKPPIQATNQREADVSSSKRQKTNHNQVKQGLWGPCFSLPPQNGASLGCRVHDRRLAPGKRQFPHWVKSICFFVQPLKAIGGVVWGSFQQGPWRGLGAVGKVHGKALLNHQTIRLQRKLRRERPPKTHNSPWRSTILRRVKNKSPQDQQNPTPNPQPSFFLIYIYIYIYILKKDRTNLSPKEEQTKPRTPPVVLFLFKQHIEKNLSPCVSSALGPPSALLPFVEGGNSSGTLISNLSTRPRLNHPEKKKITPRGPKRGHGEGPPGGEAAPLAAPGFPGPGAPREPGAPTGPQPPDPGGRRWRRKRRNTRNGLLFCCGGWGCFFFFVCVSSFFLFFSGWLSLLLCFAVLLEWFGLFCWVCFWLFWQAGDVVLVVWLLYVCLFCLGLAADFCCEGPFTDRCQRPNGSVWGKFRGGPAVLGVSCSFSFVDCM